MICCITVRLNRRTKNIIGMAGPQDMMWLESQGPAAPKGSEQETALSKRGPSIDRVRWYRLPGVTYIAN